MEPFDEVGAQALFFSYKQNGSIKKLDSLIRFLIPLIESTLCWKLGHVDSEFEETRSYALRRLVRGLERHYSPQKGALFSYVVKTAENAAVDQLRRKLGRDRFFMPLDDSLLARLSVNGASHRYVVADLTFKVLQTKTTSCDANEVSAQKWLIKNLLAFGFVFRRHEAANSMSVVFSIDPTRSRQLYDLTLLSVRRMLLSERKLRPVSANELRNSRTRALLRYRSQLSEEEFARLCFLMRGLSPVAIISSGEFTLQDVLYGPPGERALFSHSEALAAADTDRG
jgi:hypothetical protein